jgi:phosphoribosylformylglycinamidine synthase
MIQFFGNPTEKIFAVQVEKKLAAQDTHKLVWLFGNQPLLDTPKVEGTFIGPRAAMITPWSTNAVEITQNMAVSGIVRIEEFYAVEQDSTKYDPMLSQKYSE